MPRFHFQSPRRPRTAPPPERPPGAVTGAIVGGRVGAAVGTDRPSNAVTCYEVPHEYGVTKYRYTVVNDRTVLVDPSTRRIVQVID